MRINLRKNWIFVIVIFISLICLWNRNSTLPMDMVSNSDGWEIVSTEQQTLEQTWISEVKEISEVSIDSLPFNSFEADIELQIVETDSRETVCSSVRHFVFEEGVEQELSFDVDSLKVQIGKQYLFRIIFSTPEDNKLGIRTGSNYMGCSVGGEEKNVGAAFRIMFVKSSTIFWLWATFFPIFAISFFCMVFWEKKWEDVVGVAFAVLIFCLFAFGLFEQLETGVVFVYIIAGLSFGAGIYFYNNKNLQVKDLWSAGFVFYGIVLGLILINSRGLRLARWDEFSHWGLAAKDMFFYNRFAKHPDSTVLIQYYPPISTLIEYFCCYTNRLFSQGLLYTGFQLFCLSTLVGCLGGLKRFKWVSVAVVIFFTPLIFFNDVYHSIYVDPLLACGVAYVLVSYYKERLVGFNILRIISGLFLLTLTKDIGVVLSGLLSLVMIGDTFYRQWKQKKRDIKELIVPLVCLIWVCSLFFSWQIYLSVPAKTYHIQNPIVVNDQELNPEQATSECVESERTAEGVVEEGTVEEVAEGAVEEAVGGTVEETVEGAIGSSGITINGIVALIKGEAEEYKYQVVDNFVKMLFSHDSFDFDLFSLSFMDFSIVILALAFIFSYSLLNNDTERKLISFAILSFGAGLAYCLFLLVTYLFAFSQTEALILTSHNRYIGSYVCGALIAFFSLLIYQIDEKEKKSGRTVLILITALVLIASPMERFVSTNMDTELTDKQVYGYDKLSEIIRSGAGEKEKVFFVCNNSDGYARLQMRNELVPLLSDNYSLFNIYGSEDAYKRQLEIYEESGTDVRGTRSILPKEQFAQELQQYGYLVLFHVDEMFIDSYGELFEDRETIGDGTVYKVVMGENGTLLRFIGKTGIKEYR